MRAAQGERAVHSQGDSLKPVRGEPVPQATVFQVKHFSGSTESYF
jgi:hypothetical protein